MSDVESVLAKAAKEIAEKAVECAKGGDTSAMRLVLDRISPAPKERPVSFALPQISGAADLPAAVLALLQAAARGELVPGEAAQLAAVLEQYRKQTETADLAERIKALEEAHARQS